MSRLAGIDEGRGDLPAARKFAAESTEISRQIGEAYRVPHYLALEAHVEVASGRLSQADELLSEAEEIVEGMMVNVASPTMESSLIGEMSEVYVEQFKLAATQLRDPGKAFRALESAGGRVMAEALESPGPRTPLRTRHSTRPRVR